MWMLRISFEWTNDAWTGGILGILPYSTFWGNCYFLLRWNTKIGALGKKNNLTNTETHIYRIYGVTSSTNQSNKLKSAAANIEAFISNTGTDTVENIHELTIILITAAGIWSVVEHLPCMHKKGLRFNAISQKKNVSFVTWKLLYWTSKLTHILLKGPGCCTYS